MKSFHRILLSLLLFPGTSQAQDWGTILFDTYVEGQIDAPVIWPDGRGIGAHFSNIVAQLYLVTAGGVYTPLVPATTFPHNPKEAIATRYVVARSEPVTVPGSSPGQQVTVVMRIWAGANSYDTAIFFRAESNPFTVTLGGTTSSGEILPPGLLTGLQSNWVGPLSPPFLFTTWIYSIRRDADKIMLGVNSSFYPTYIIESSLDFSQWTPVLTNTFVPFEHELPWSSNGRALFYRLR